MVVPVLEVAILILMLTAPQRKKGKGQEKGKEKGKERED